MSRHDTPDFFQRISRIFETVRELPEHERPSCLDRECAGDEHLRREVEELLTHHDDSGGAFRDEDLADGLMFAGDGLEGLVVHSAVDATPPRRIGGYTILRSIGEGSMGTVYEAEQDTPRRRVALKILRSDLVSEELLRRFELETEVLGRLHHPDIAQIYEAGMADTPAGTRPYFAMELVEGKNLLEYADRARIGSRDKLRLIARIANAIEHAHHRGVIHRDLKPDNVLVTEDGRPKILDFGIARAVDATGRSTRKTNPGELLGTVNYMSPEQASGAPDDVDTRSDVYALGVMAFELLDSRPPYDLAGKSLSSILQTIADANPREFQPRDPPLPRDVQTIVHKALEKERGRRYQSASDFAEDIARFLADEPIEAREPTRLYRLQKFARRNRALVAGTAATLLTLVCGVVAATWLALEARQNEKTARENFSAAEAAAELANQNSKLAEQAARVATEERDRALWNETRSRLEVAKGHLGLGKEHTLAALRSLDAVPENQRGWEWRFLRNRMLVLRGHRDDVTRLVFSPGGERMASVASRSVRLWDTETFDLVTVVPRETKERFHDVVFSPDGRRFVIVSSRARALTLLSAVDGAEVQVLADERDTSAAVFGLDSKVLISGTTRGRITVRSTEAPVNPKRLVGHEKRIVDLAVSRDGRTLVSGSEDRTARIWDLPTGSTRHVLSGHALEVRHVRVNSDASRVATSSRLTATRLWDARTGERIAALPGTLERARAPVLEFSPDGTLLAASSGPKNAGVYKASDGSEVSLLRGHSAPVIALGFTPDGERVVTGSFDGEVFLFEARAGKLVSHLSSERFRTDDLAVSPSGDLVAVTTIEKAVHVLMLEDLVREKIRESPSMTTRAAFSPDGEWLVTSSMDRKLRIYCAHSRELLTEWDVGDTVMDFDFSPDGERIVTGCDGIPHLPHAICGCRGREGAVRNLVTGRVLFTFPRDEGICSVRYSPDGRYIAASAPVESKGVVDLRSAADGELLHTFDPVNAHIYNVCFDPTGRFLASASSNREVRVRDCETRKLLWRQRKHRSEVHAVAFSHDGRWLASGGRDDTIRFWDAATGEPRGVVAGLSGYINALEFTPDGRRLISGGFDGSVRLWDLERREQALSFSLHDGWVTRVTVDGSGQRIASTAIDGLVRILDSREFWTRRRAAQEARRRQIEVTPLVDALFRRHGDASAVVAAIRSDDSMDAEGRVAALKIVLRRSDHEGRPSSEDP